MVEFIMLVGVPGSGKSTYAQQLSELKNAVILSSDELRLELFGDISDNTRNYELFQELNARTIQNLKNGINVIYDATNINSKRRQNLIKQLPNDVWKECHYLCIDERKCLMNDLTRKERNVGYEVINNMFKSLQVPMLFEGWNNIIIKNDINYTDNEKRNFRNLFYILFQRKLSLEEYADMLYCLRSINLLDFPQDSKYHTLSVGRHCYETYSYVYDNYNGDDKEIMSIASLLHDIGKPMTKCFEEGSRYATYKNHDNKSAQIALRALNGIGYPKALQVAELIQLHMRLSWRDTPEARTANEVLLKTVGKELYDKLYFFRQADMSAK